MTSVLEVGLQSGGDFRRVGILVRDDQRNVAFHVDESYLEEGPNRPILSTSWYAPGDDAKTLARLHIREDKIARFGNLPPWFTNLLPEGALRAMVERGMPAGDASDFDVLAWLGKDLPGAVVVRPADDGFGVGPFGGAAFGGTAVDRQPRPAEETSVLRPGRLRFSLAGVQLKFSSVRTDDRVTLPAEGEVGHGIVKLANDRYPRLPEIEYASMRLAAAAGVRTATCELLPTQAAADIPRELRPGDSILWVERFDRGPRGQRTHMEDFAQVLQAVGDQKYIRGNEETVVNVAARLSDDRAATALEAVERIVVNILLGNTDAHLKNWSFTLDPQERPAGYRGHTVGGPPPRVVLSPAYDVVSIHLLSGETEMALELQGSRNPFRTRMAHFHRMAKLVGIRERLIEETVEATIDRAATTWGSLSEELPLSAEERAKLSGWWRRLQITQRWASPFG